MVQVIKGRGIQFRVVNAYAKVILDKQGEIHELEGVNQPAGKQGFIRFDDAVGLFENLGGDICG
ncbi:MAG TPA: hypothetical protein VII97_08935 [Anaerolineales bacterium]